MEGRRRRSRAAGQASALPSGTGLGAIGRPRRWRRFYRIRLSSDQRRAGAQRGVATVQIHPAPPSSRSVFGQLGESLEIPACARDLRLRVDPGERPSPRPARHRQPSSESTAGMSASMPATLRRPIEKLFSSPTLSTTTSPVALPCRTRQPLDHQVATRFQPSFRGRAYSGWLFKP
jgi:hypothetical protein